MKKNLASSIFLFAVLIIWQAGAMKMNASYSLPTPVQMIQKVWELRVPRFTVHLPYTMSVTLIGLGISVALGLFLAIIMDMNENIQHMLYPIVIASQTIPTTALAPLFVLWFGYTIWSKVLVTVLMTFFPITITVFDGFQSTKREMEELMQSFDANSKDIFLKLKIPNALPYIFSAIKMAIPLSIIGAAIGEWLGAQQGLGYYSKRMMTQLDGAGVFAPIVLLSVVAMIIVGIVSAVEKRALGGRRSYVDGRIQKRDSGLWQTAP